MSGPVDASNAVGKSPNVDGLLLYLGHHKCATQWMNSVVGDICRGIGRTMVRYNNAQQFDGDLAGAVTDPTSTFVCYTNAESRFIRTLSGFRGFHMVRDPRDIVVSSYFSHLYSHPTSVYPALEAHRAALQECSESDGLMLEMEKRARQFDVMLQWDYQRSDVLEVRMEDVTADPYEQIHEIAEFLGLVTVGGLSRDELATIVVKNDFSAKAGRPKGEEDVRSHYRKGVPGDWKEHFEPRHVDYFKEHYNRLLLSLGYESEPDWGPAVG